MPPSSDHPHEVQRAPFLSFFLAVTTLGGLLLFLIFVSGGFFLYVLIALAALFFVGLWHYLLWGSSMHKQTEGEREEERVREELRGDEW